MKDINELMKQASLARIRNVRACLSPEDFAVFEVGMAVVAGAWREVVDGREPDGFNDTLAALIRRAMEADATLCRRAAAKIETESN